MPTIEIKQPDTDRLIEAYDKLPKATTAASRSAGGTSGFFMSRAVAKHMATQGEFNWPKGHPMGRRFRTRRKFGFGEGFSPHGSGQSRFFRQRKRKKPFEIFSRFPRYVIQNDQVKIGFAVKDEPKAFNRKLEKTIARIQAGERIRVTAKMRRFYGTQRGLIRGRPKIGVNFFPIRKNTNVLKTDPRPIEKPVFNKIGRRVIPKYEKAFVKSLGRKSVLADREFRKGLSTAKD